MIYAIGDVHGCLDMLDRLLEVFLPLVTAEDSILFLGDYVDRGPDSRGVVERVMELSRSFNVIALRGNHEQMMLDSLEYFMNKGSRLFQELALSWFQNGADQTLASYPGSGSWWTRIPEEHWAFFRSTEMEYVEGTYRFVHAGIVPPGVKWHEPDLDPRLWIRDPFLYSRAKFHKVVVFGHTPLREPVFLENKIGIDTGAVFGGRLTAIAVDPAKPYRSEDIRIFQSE